MIELRNKSKKALEKSLLVRAAEEKKTRKQEPGNPYEGGISSAKSWG
jgi:hypothetical protein